MGWRAVPAWPVTTHRQQVPIPGNDEIDIAGRCRFEQLVGRAAPHERRDDDVRIEDQPYD